MGGDEFGPLLAKFDAVEIAYSDDSYDHSSGKRISPIMTAVSLRNLTTVLRLEYVYFYHAPTLTAWISLRNSIPFEASANIREKKLMAP